MKIGPGMFHGYGEMAGVAVCVGIVAAAPLGVHGETWAVIGWTAASNMASYVKGALETKPGSRQEAQKVIVDNLKSDPIPTQPVKEKL